MKGYIVPRFKMLATAMVATAGFTALPVASAVAEELGIIQVESTTIDDRFEAKRGEPSNIGVIQGEEVDAAHTQNVQQMLQGIPGVTTELQSGDSLKIHIRGVENQVYMGEKPGVAVVIDGVPVFERTGRVNIDLDNIESIKVVKGGASYLFGDDALSGAVIITTKRGAKQAGTKLAAEVGSFGYYKGLAQVGTAGENYNGHVQISRRETDGYYDDSASKADYINGKLQYYVDDFSDLTFGFEHADRMKNSHGAVKGVTAAKEDPKSYNPEYDDYASHYEVLLDKLFLTYSRDLSETSNLMVNTYRFTDATDYLSSPIDGEEDAYNYDNDYDQVQQGIKAEYRAGGESLAWMVATDLRDNTYDSEVIFNDCTGLGAWAGCVEGEQYGDNSTEEQVKALYGELKYRPAEKWVLTLNGRHDRIDLDYTDYLDSDIGDEKSFDVSSWRLGANHALRDNVDIYSNVSTGFRAPSASQLFVGTGSPTMRTDPNPDLEPEHAVNIELGVRSRTALFGVPMELDAAIFQIDRTDHIQASAGQYTTAEDNRYENIGDIRSRGLELALGSDRQRKYSFDLAYTYLDTEYTSYDSFYLQTYNTDYDPTCNPYVPPFSCEPEYNSTVYDNTGNEVPRVPNHHLNLKLYYAPKANWLLTTEVDTISDYYADEINELKIDGHSTVNLLLNYYRDVGNSNWEFFARVDNLFDEFYYNTARSNGDGNDDGLYDEEDLSLVVNPGRSYTAGFSVKF
ncbi:MAG: TonB-dependent receptor [Gammaproteobacteria bacterium]|nr:TonB-dependent receptor [Gammaproteobacteria bacterium]MCW9089045.1 TonB-dependent receptor [Gammaproteobacteria bacterium]